MRGAIRTAVVLFSAAVVAGCSDDDVPVPNRPPAVAISSGPMEGDEVSYRVEFQWQGSDPDGRVDHYRHATDPPAEFTEMEIAGGGEGITTEFIPGEDGEPDRTRVTKVVDGGTVGFDWVHTHDTGKSCAFSTPDADSTGDSLSAPLPRFTGTHAFYVTAVDDDDAVSAPAHVGFTATSITPQTLLEFPAASDEIYIVGSAVPFRLNGVDPDGPGGPLGPARPVAYLVKLVNLGALDPPKNLLGAGDPSDIVYRLAAHIPWEQVDASRVTLPVEPGQYVFAVRAVDESGAVDPFVGYGRPGEAANAIRFQALPQAPRPVVTLSEPTLGNLRFSPLTSGEVTLEAPTATDLYFTVLAEDDVDTCEVTGGPESWGAVCTEFPCPLPPLTVGPGIQVLTIRAHSRYGVEASYSVLLQGADFPLDRELLIVDDSRDNTYPRDAEHDAFWQGLAEGSGRFAEEDLRPEILRYDAFGANDVFYADPQPPGLGLLGRYRTIFWTTQGAGSSGRTALGGSLRNLGSYLGAGGTLWVLGQYTAGAMVPTPSGASNLVYPVEIPEDSFPFRYLKLLAGSVHNDKNARNEVHGMVGVRPFPGRPEVFGAMEIDPAKQSPGLRGTYGVGACDVVFDALLEEHDPGFTGRIDSLYVFGAIGPTASPPRGSVYDGRLCAIRWHDPDPGREQGRTLWFGVPLYWFRNDQAQETFNRAVDWFREEGQE